MKTLNENIKIIAGTKKLEKFVFLVGCLTIINTAMLILI